MTDFLTDLLAVTMGGGLVILLLLFLGRVGRMRYGAKWRCLAWLLLCLRMAVPGPLLPADVSIAPAPIQVELPGDRVVYQAGPVGESPQPGEGFEERAPAPAAPEEPAVSISASQLLFALWVTGAAAVLLWAFLRHGRFLAWMRRRGRPVEDPRSIGRYIQLAEQVKLSRLPKLLACENLPSPALVGLFRKTLLLPAEPMEEDVMDYVILHELIHYRSRHIWLKALALWVCALHWFNPCAWLMARAIQRDTELDCDERVLAHLPKEKHTAYAHALVNVATERRMA